MTDDHQQFVLEQLRLIRKEEALANRKLGAVAESMVSMCKQLDGIARRLDHMSHSIDGYQHPNRGTCGR